MFENLFSSNGLYARAMNWLWNILVISVLWLVCSLPLITLGAASTAAYYAMAKAVRHQTGKPIPEFFSALRTNFRQATILSLPVYGAAVILFAECVYLYSDSSVPLAMLYLFYFLLAALLAAAGYLWPCLSRFSRGSLSLMKMSAVLVFRHLISTILLLLLLAAAIIGVYLMPWSILLLPGLCIYAQTFLLEPILLRYSPKPKTEEEQQKWYYQ